jgi:hypothetical protein
MRRIITSRRREPRVAGTLAEAGRATGGAGEISVSTSVMVRLTVQVR